jgi:transposase
MRFRERIVARRGSPLMQPISQELCDRIKRLCALHTNLVVAQLCHVNRNTVWRVKKRGFKAGHSGPTLLQRPDDFAIHADKMTIIDLAKHYRCSPSMIQRWVREIGGRDYKSPYRARPQKPMPPVAVIVAAIAEHGPIKAAPVLGVDDSTLWKWRNRLGLPIARKRKKALTLEQRKGWVERYVEERRHA